MHLEITREFYIPAGAVKVTDKLSDGVAYIYATPKGEPAAMVFHGKSHKPDWRFRYHTEFQRTQAVQRYFEGRRARRAMQAEQKAKAARPSQLQPGHILVSSWGYEQTNIDWYEVTAVISATMVEIRPIGAVIDYGLRDQGTCCPRAGDYKGPATRHRVRWGDSVKINECQRAHLWDGRPRSWSSYH